MPLGVIRKATYFAKIRSATGLRMRRENLHLVTRQQPARHRRAQRRCGTHRHALDRGHQPREARGGPGCHRHITRGEAQIPMLDVALLAITLDLHEAVGIGVRRGQELDVGCPLQHPDHRRVQGGRGIQVHPQEMRRQVGRLRGGRHGHQRHEHAERAAQL